MPQGVLGGAGQIDPTMNFAQNLVIGNCLDTEKNSDRTKVTSNLHPRCVLRRPSKGGVRAETHLHHWDEPFFR